jgi:hypothetical protein
LIAIPEQTEEKAPPAVASQKTIDRLVQGSIRKTVRSSDPTPAVPRHITKVSEELTKGIQWNLYEESVQAQARRNERAQKLSRQREQWEAVALEQAKQNARKWPSIDSSEPCEVAGTDVHVERMKKSRAMVPVEEPPSVPTAVVVRPFAFDVRETEKELQSERMQEAVLREISAILHAK